MSLVELADRAAAADGVAPFNEATLFALRDRVRARVLVHQSDADGRVIAAAYAAGDAPADALASTSCWPTASTTTGRTATCPPRRRWRRPRGSSRGARCWRCA
jgi:hypothetical protein